MPTVLRTTAVWTGAPGLPGYSQFYQEVTGTVSTQAQSGHDDVHDFFEGMAALIPEEITITVDPVYQRFDVGSGDLVGEDAVDEASDAVSGSMVGGWNAQIGVLVEWITADIVAGRHLRGRTYVVPLGAVGDADGTLPAATITTVQDWASAISGRGHDFVVWHRPVAGAGGQVGLITGNRVRDHAAILRSRML